VLFETRYFWAVLTARDKEAVDALKGLFERSKSAYASSISIYEVYKLTLEHEDDSVARLRASTIRKQFTIVDVTSEIAEEGARIHRRLRAPMADSLMMATARQLRVPCVTDDPHFTEVKRVWI
jgi:predicted nucleic acid-binding protein